MSKPKYALLSQLRKSIKVLKHRRDMIPKYVDQDLLFTGKSHYTMDMIPELDLQIAEMNAAIRGIEKWKKEEGTRVRGQN
jgi:hypothetical protein